MPKAIEAEDVELLKRIAEGTTRFGPVPDEPSDSPRWVGEVERLRRLRGQGLIRMPEPEHPGDPPGYPASVGPCELTPSGQEIVERSTA
jgi:hypothetical protein